MTEHQTAGQSELAPGHGVAFIFPGQGSQNVGMLGEAALGSPVIGQTFAEASDALSLDLWALAKDGPAEDQALTANTQPLILTASIALYRLWCERGGAVPSVAAGHSLGEFSALVAAGSLAFDDAVRLVRLRGRAMQESVPVGEGAMAAVLGLEDATINRVCDEISDDAQSRVMAVNFNSPGQVVIAGHAPAVDEAMARLKSEGAKRILPLPVSAPFHTPLMGHAAQVLEEALLSVELNDPRIPVISNVDARPQTDAESITRLLVKQVVAPVRWTDCVATMVDMGCDQFVECGPGRVLSGLLRRIDKQLAGHAIEKPGDLEAAMQSIGEDPSS